VTLTFLNGLSGDQNLGFKILFQIQHDSFVSSFKVLGCLHARDKLVGCMLGENEDVEPGNEEGVTSWCHSG
jgi:hypothetical protein